MDRRARTRVPAFALAAVLIAAATAGFAQSSTTDQDHATHHPPAAGNAPAEPGEMSKGMMGQERGGMMGGGMAEMMPMMRNMMSMIGAQGGIMGMMGMGDHVEGRIAFLKAELKIADAQMNAWNAFADVLRANSRRMMEMRNSMMAGGMMGQSGARISAPDRLDRMERMMTGALEAVKATKSALTPLYAVLTDEQKKTADELLIVGHMGMM